MEPFRQRINLPVPVKCIAGGLGNWTFWGGCMLMQTSQEFSISVTIYILGYYMSFCERRYNKALFWGSPFYVCTPSPFPLLRYIEILERGKQISRVISKGVLTYLGGGKTVIATDFFKREKSDFRRGKGARHSPTNSWTLRGTWSIPILLLLKVAGYCKFRAIRCKARAVRKLYKRFVTAIDPISSLNEGFRLRN